MLRRRTLIFWALPSLFASAATLCVVPAQPGASQAPLHEVKNAVLAATGLAVN
jgi:hypothetical protein